MAGAGDEGVTGDTLVPEYLEFPEGLTRDGSNAFTFESRDESVRSRPSVAAKISDYQAQLLMHRCRRDEHSNVLMAPKVTLFNGQQALMQDEVQRPFVTGVRPREHDRDTMDPMIKVISEGWRMQLQAEVSEDESVQLRCVLTQSEIENVELAHLPFLAADEATAKVTVQVPSVTRSTVRSNVRLERNESLLIASPGTFKSDDSDQQSQATFYMITPRLIREQVVVQ